MTITQPQINFIQSLCAERTEALAGDYAHVMDTDVTTKQEASDLISELKKVPRDPVQVDPVDANRIDLLEQATVAPKDSDFRDSLVSQFRDRGRLSDRQWKYVDRLTANGLKGDALAEWASAYGHRTGQCVFCFRDLSDERSVHVGYGKECASKHGLPWGVSI